MSLLQTTLYFTVVAAFTLHIFLVVALSRAFPRQSGQRWERWRILAVAGIVPTLGALLVSLLLLVQSQP